MNARATRARRKVREAEAKAKLASLKKENLRLKSNFQEMHCCPLSADILMRADVEPPSCVMNLLTHLINNVGGEPLRNLHDYSFCVCNAVSADEPLVYVSPGFLSLTGFAKNEVIGRNCRFLPGPVTNPDVVRRVFSNDLIYSIKSYYIM